MSQIRFRVAAAVLLAAAGVWGHLPAYATGSVECHARDGADLVVTLTLGALPVTPVLHVRARLGPLAWSTVEGEEAQPWSLTQAFVDERWLAVDLVDEQGLRQLASIRLLQTEEASRMHRYGYLQLHGRVVHPLSCLGP
jgi:hypothetical protein